MFIFAAILIAVEALIGVTTVSLSKPSIPPSSQTQYVLGESDTTPSDLTPPPDSTPADATPASEPAPASSDQPAPTNQPSPDQTPLSEQPSPTAEAPVETSPTPTAEVSPQLQNTNEPNGQNNNGENNNLQNQLNIQDTSQASPSSSEGNPNHASQFQNDVANAVSKTSENIFQDNTDKPPSDAIAKSSITEAVNQSEQIEKAKDPQEKASLVTQFATNTLATVGTNVASGNISNADFQTQKLNSEITRSLDLIQALPQNQAAELKTKIDTICRNTEFVLRPQQLTVPESVEESFEITRGTCMQVTGL